MSEQRRVRRVDGIGQIQRVRPPLSQPAYRRPIEVPVVKETRRRPLVFMGLALVAFLVAGLAVTVPKMAAAARESRLNAIVASVTTRVFTGHSRLDSAKLQADVNAIIAAHPGQRVGVSVVDEATGTQMTMGDTAPFVAASTAKVLTAAAYMNLVEKGQASLSEQINGTPAQRQLQLMLQQSNNDSWQALSNRVGLARMQQYAQSLGMRSYQESDNTMTPSDDALLLKQLAAGKLLNSTNTQTLLSYMQNTNNDDMIPYAAPNGATVYHKYGQLDGYLHDTAIIKNGDRTYSLSIYTASNNSYLPQVQLIREITRTVAADMPTN